MSKTDDAADVGWGDKQAAGRLGAAATDAESAARGGANGAKGLAGVIAATPPDEGWAGVVERARRRGYLGGGDGA